MKKIKRNTHLKDICCEIEDMFNQCADKNFNKQFNELMKFIALVDEADEFIGDANPYNFIEYLKIRAYEEEKYEFLSLLKSYQLV